MAIPSKTETAVPDSVLRPSQTCEITGYCDMQLRRLEAAGLFPRRFKLNPNGGPFGAVGHSRREVEAWLESRRASRETHAA